MNTLKFTCTECGGHRLNEVMTNIIVSSEITHLSDSLDFEYDNSYNEEGEIDRYECILCGYILKFLDEPIQCNEDVICWIDRERMDTPPEGLIFKGR